MTCLSLNANPNSEKPDPNFLCTARFSVLMHCQEKNSTRPDMYPFKERTMSCTQAYEYFKEKLNGFDHEYGPNFLSFESTMFMPCDTKLSRVTSLQICRPGIIASLIQKTILPPYDPNKVRTSPLRDMSIFFNTIESLKNCQTTTNSTYAQASKILEAELPNK